MQAGRTLRLTIGATAAALVIAGAPVAAKPVRSAPFCQVVDGAKWLAETGGTTSLCAAIRKAAGAHASGKARVAVRVISESRLSASIVKPSGQALPDLNFAVSDARLTRPALARFAQAIADALAAK